MAGALCARVTVGAHDSTSIPQSESVSSIVVSYTHCVSILCGRPGALSVAVLQYRCSIFEGTANSCGASGFFYS